MSRLAVLALTLTILPWYGESFVSTIASSDTTKTESSLAQSHGTRNYERQSIRRSRVRPHLERQLQQDHQPANDPNPSSLSSPIVTSIVSYRRSSLLLNAALLPDTSSSTQVEQGRRRGRSIDVDKKGSGWHRRILGKISRRRQSRGRKTSSSLPSTPIEHQEAQPGTTVMYEKVCKDDDDAFVVRNFDLVDPDTVLSVVQVERKQISSGPLSPPLEVKQSKPPVIDSAYFDVAITKATPDARAMTETSLAQEHASTITNQTSKRGLICRFLENFLMERIGQEWPTETPENLKINVRSSSDKYNNIGRLLFKAHYRAEATLSSDRIVFPMIRFSSIRLKMEKVTLNLIEFCKDKSNEDCDNHSMDDNVHKNHNGTQLQQHQGNHPKRSINTDRVSTKAIGKGRYSKQFDIHIEDLTMSRHDLLFSSCVKNGLRQLLINVLKDRGIRSDSILITSIDILRNGKISIIGEAKMHFPAPSVRFEVRSEISFNNRGHVVTFPGLEVSLNRDIGLFVPVHPTLDLDVGHNTKFRSIDIDGKNKLLKIAASITITPDRTLLTQNYLQTSDAFQQFSFTTLDNG